MTMTASAIKRLLRQSIEGSTNMDEFEILLRETLREYADEQSADGWTNEAEKAAFLASGMKKGNFVR